MPTSYTSLLGFALPATGELSGTWGTTVNNSITELVEDAIAATATASVAGGDWTLSTTGSGSANEARCAILIPTGSPGVSRNIIVPSQSKAYVVINQSNAAVVVKGAATTGVSLIASEKAVVAWNGSDFVKIASSEFSGVVPVSGGGTGQTSYTNGQLLIGNTTGNTLTKATLTAGPGVSITNGTGSITIAATGSGGTVTNVNTSGSVNGLTLTGGPITGSGTVTLGGAVNASTITTGTLGVSYGGTGLTTVGSSGNVLTSNGSAWVSQAAAGANIQSFQSGGTWTKPAGAKFVYVEVYAGGGGGRGGAGSPSPSPANFGGMGGGGGGYSSQFFSAPELGATEAITVGAGGGGGGGGSPGGPQSGGDGANGGTSNFGVIVYAYGGRGGGNASGAGGFAWASGATMTGLVNSPNQWSYNMSQQPFGGIGQAGSPQNGFAFSIFGGGAGGQQGNPTGTRDGLGSFYGGGGGGAGGPGGGSPGGGTGGTRQRGAFSAGGGAAGTPGPAYFMGGGGGNLQGTGGAGNIAGGGGGGGGGPIGSTGAPGGAGGGGLVVVYSW